MAQMMDRTKLKWEPELCGTLTTLWLMNADRKLEETASNFGMRHNGLKFCGQRLVKKVAGHLAGVSGSPTWALVCRQKVDNALSVSS